MLLSERTRCVRPPRGFLWSTFTNLERKCTYHGVVLEQVQRNSNPYLAVIMLDKQARHRVENPKPSEGPVSPEAVQPKLTFEVNKTFLKLKHK